MIAEFITFGGVLFWIIVGVIALILAAQVNEEKTGAATLTLLATIAAIVAFTNTPIIETVRANPLYVLYGILAYIGIAAVWAFIKWRVFFLPNLFDRYEELRSRFLKTAGPNGTPLTDFPADPAVRDEFNKRSEVQRLNISYNRMVGYNKGRITAWMVFWPFSLLGTFVGDFMHRVFTSLYKAIAGGLQRMSDSMASKYSELD